MTHHMKLHPQPFDMIAAGVKTIELRLYDEKRKAIEIGDQILFTNSDEPHRQIRTEVTALHVFPSFAQLYQSLPLDKCGYLPHQLSEADPADMEKYYSVEKQRSCGVVGIEIRVLSH